MRGEAHFERTVAGIEGQGPRQRDLKGFEGLALFSRVLCARGRRFITGFACALPARDAEQVDGAEDLSAGGDGKEV